MKKLSKLSILPNKSLVFKAFQLCNYEDLKVIIIGQDPYPQKGYATGIAFGNNKDIYPKSVSLKLIKERINEDFYQQEDIDFDYTLESWCKQGILLLNSSLTCEEGKPGSHNKLWFPFIKAFLIELNKSNTGLVYILLGTQAQLFEPYINSKVNHILKYKHPAYYARINEQFICDGFKKAYDIVKLTYNYELKF